MMPFTRNLKPQPQCWTIDDLERIINVCKKEGVFSLKLGELDIKFSWEDSHKEESLKVERVNVHGQDGAMLSDPDGFMDNGVMEGSQSDGVTGSTE